MSTQIPKFLKLLDLLLQFKGFEIPSKYLLLGFRFKNQDYVPARASHVPKCDRKHVNQHMPCRH